jgi:hypothetical protein
LGVSLNAKAPERFTPGPFFCSQLFFTRGHPFFAPLRSHTTQIHLLLDRQDLFGDDAVGPFDQRNENGRIAELCVPIREIAFRDPTGPGTCSSSKDRNVFRDDLLAQLAERRPTNGNHCVQGSFAHKIVRVSS